MLKLRTHLLIVALALGLVLTSCVEDEPEATDNDQPSNEDVEAPLVPVETLTEGAPSNDELPSDAAKSDVIPPTQFDLMETQSPVSDQGRRGVCSIFSAVGLMEHLYLADEQAPALEFSEQYLQWSVKFEVGRFTHTSGSTASANLRAISEYGIPVEDAWPYESSPWTTADDDECEGDNQPTRCYTNGLPPEQAEEAPKYQLPSGRWISTRADDIKTFMYENEQAVIVGGDFFYQAWNHSGSELPTNQDYWRRGYVQDPNEEDRQISLEDRVGHSFLLVGWDDEYEVEMMGPDGEVKTDENGEPITQQGFFVFKNSWGTGSFGVDNPYGDGYGLIQYDHVEELTGRVSDFPEDHHIPEGDSPINCGDGELECDGACVPIDDDNCGACGTVCTGAEVCQDNQCVEPTGTEEIFEWTEGPQSIPDASGWDDSEHGVLTADIEVDGSGTLHNVAVDVDIEHTWNGDLQIELIGPSGDAELLREADGGAGEDVVESFDASSFVDQDSEGTWTLQVTDTQPADEGTLNSWALVIER